MSDSSTTSLARPAPARRSPPAPAWLLGSATLLLLVVAERWLLETHAFPGDSWSAQLGESHKPWLVWGITRVYQQVGRPLVAIAEVLVMLAWLQRSAGARAARGLLLALLASGTCGLIKTLCGPTPLWVALHHVGTNFPSGVVTFMTASGGYLAVIAWRQGRRAFPAVMAVAIAGAGPARILGGQHLLSDVLGGYALGAAWLIVSYAYVTRSAEQTQAWFKPFWQLRPKALGDEADGARSGEVGPARA